jgi:selenocysteine lyase/cysteine desulfurase
MGSFHQKPSWALSFFQQWQSSSRELIGCFSAASNVTGILADVHAITVCLHKHGALAFWDYATAGPYVEIDVNPVVARLVYSLNIPWKNVGENVPN